MSRPRLALAMVVLWAGAVCAARAACGTAVIMDADSPRGELLDAVGLRYVRAGDPAEAISAGERGLIIVDANPQNLKRLAGNLERVKAFGEGGGWLMLWGLTPEGLADFNRIVGVGHLIRPFEMEEVDLPRLAAERDPLIEGVSPVDVFMESGKWSGGNEEVPLRADDAWTYVVDCDDLAPFCAFPGPEYWNKENPQIGADHYPRNMVNGLTYHWRFGFTLILHRGEPTAWPVELPREEEIVGFSVAPCTIYHKITGMSLDFGDGKEPVELALKPTGERQDFVFPPRKCRKMTMGISDWQETAKTDVVAIRNLWIVPKRSAEFYARVRPLLNIGVLVKYPVGKGGVVLNQLNVPQKERNERNVKKKRAIVSALLQNLGATVEPLHPRAATPAARSEEAQS